MEQIILGCLSIQPMNSYGLKQFIANSVNAFSDLSFGTLYPALKRMQEKELIVLAIEDGKKIYHLTKKGRLVLDSWVSDPQSKFKMNYEFLTKLFFFDLLEPTQVKISILAHLAEIEQEKNSMEKTMLAYENHVDPYQKMTIQFAIDFYKFLLTWYQEFLVELEKE